MQEILMHRVRFVHGGTSINPYTRSHPFIPFVEPSQRFLMHIKFVSPSGIASIFRKKHRQVGAFTCWKRSDWKNSANSTRHAMRYTHLMFRPPCRTSKSKRLAVHPHL